MNSFTHPEYASHERVVFVNDKSSGLQAIIALHTQFKQCQEDAEKNKRGLWAEEDPLAPWDWRRR